jgi:hypothetical protein
MDFTSLESESQIEDFSVWVASMKKPEVTSLLYIFHIYCLLFTSISIRRLVEAQDTKLMVSSSAYQVLFENEP